MVDWALRARREIPESSHHTDVTDETCISSVLSVGSKGPEGNRIEVSSVLSAPPRPIVEASIHLGAQLTAAIHECCDLRGDDDMNRAALIREAGGMDMPAQADLLEHFREEALRWRCATGTDKTDERSAA